MYNYKTSGTCSTSIAVELENDVIKSVAFTGGCNGNLKAVSALVQGKKVDEVESLLSGITCGFKSTSCGDQLSKAVRAAYEAGEGR